ncbi:hypothetical protein AB3S75_031368 [Citrus x aurantiifolia]
MCHGTLQSEWGSAPVTTRKILVHIIFWKKISQRGTHLLLEMVKTFEDKYNRRKYGQKLVEEPQPSRQPLLGSAALFDEVSERSNSNATCVTRFNWPTSSASVATEPHDPSSTRFNVKVMVGTTLLDGRCQTINIFNTARHFLWWQNA